MVALAILEQWSAIPHRLQRGLLSQGNLRRNGKNLMKVGARLMYWDM
jgi:uncharacterized protein YjeT (DUF2065 family)